ncbi:HAX1 protein, partial [Rhinopomastus cyanomelas]|nr:HAX1 protein [Rhinopomastus cyanomelas]
MTFFEAFRGFFGLPGQRRPREPLFGRATWDDEEEEEARGGPHLEQPPPDFGFGAFELLLRDLGEALGSFGGSWAGPPRPFEPLLPGPSTGGTLRDSMLKQPESP